MHSVHFCATRATRANPAHHLRGFHRTHRLQLLPHCLELATLGLASSIRWTASGGLDTPPRFLPMEIRRVHSFSQLPSHSRPQLRNRCRRSNASAPARFVSCFVYSRHHRPDRAGLDARLSPVDRADSVGGPCAPLSWSTEVRWLAVAHGRPVTLPLVGLSRGAVS